MFDRLSAWLEAAASRSRSYAGEGMLMFWSHTPVAPWQDEKWIEEMRRSLRSNAYARLVLNEFASSESSFIDMSAWDACVNPNLTPAPPDKSLHIWVGVDASVKRDSTALIAVTIDKKSQMLRLVHHRVFTPTPDEPINFEDTIERTILAWKNQYALRGVAEALGKEGSLRPTPHGAYGDHSPR
jgi:hypothetical protein